MREKHVNSQYKFALILGSLMLITVLSFGTEESVAFSSGRWQLAPGCRVEKFLEREALTCSAILKDVEFENGIVEVDMAFTGGRCFPGIVFHRTDESNYEEFYVRPHKSGQPHALQYTPVFNRLSAWQLYYGEGYTAVWNLPSQKWVHLKVKIMGNQARVFLGNGNRPAMVITDLKHGGQKGALGLKLTGRPGLAYFSDFRYRTDDTLEFDQPPNDLGLIKLYAIRCILD